VTDTRELEARFWKALGKDRTVMLGATGVAPRPMTALAEDDRAPLWFFTASDTQLAESLEGSRGHAAMATFVAKDHDLFATLGGHVVIDNDRAVIDRLWNPFVAAWFEKGKDDPKLRLLRMDSAEAHVWLNENSLLAGVKLLLDADPRRVTATRWATSTCGDTGRAFGRAPGSRPALAHCLRRLVAACRGRGAGEQLAERRAFHVAGRATRRRVAQSVAQGAQTTDRAIQVVRLRLQQAAVDPRTAVCGEHLRDLVEREARRAPERDQRQSFQHRGIEHAP
jgi:general stress protein 26